jgi:signal transduction histidine kinase
MRSLKTQLSLNMVLAVLVTVALASFMSNAAVNRRFAAYVATQQSARAADIADDLSRQYDSLNKAWNLDYIHALAMYSLYDGFIIKVMGSDGEIVWDTEVHDMEMCIQIMDDITSLMEKEKNPGGFVTTSYDLSQNSQLVGKATISYYGPYFLDENAFEFLEAMNIGLFATGAFACLFAVALGVVIARRISKPICQAAEAAKQISLGDYGAKFEGFPATVELNDLADAINYLSSALSQQESLRKRLTTDAAHELRTPLTAVSSHLEAMIEHVWEPTPERLQSCYEELVRLGKLVADLGRLAEIEGNSLMIEQVSLPGLLQAVCGNMSIEMEKKNLSLDISGWCEPIDADKDRLKQVFANLVANAIKYTHNGGSIWVSIYELDDDAAVIVEDDGIGIPEEELPLVFERYYRTDLSRSRQTGGSGIGLAIVKSIVYAHGGSVAAESREGEGAKFTVTLPKKARRSGK